MTELLTSLSTNYTLKTIIYGASVLGAVSGALGSFALLRRQSLIGDAISHSALPGIALAFLLTGSKAPASLLTGALVTGWLSILVMTLVVRGSRIKEDGALGLVLSVFFGLGIVLLTYIQKLPNASQAGLDKFLFGQAATLMERDVNAMLALGIPAVIILILLWKEMKLLAFDPDFAASYGLPVKRLEILLITLLVVAVVIGLQTVGVVLMSALVVAPAAAARQWTDKLGRMVLLAALFGAGSGVVGAVLSSAVPRLPTGPTIIVCVSAVVGVSMLLAPNRGLVWRWLRERQDRKRLQVDAVLEDLYLLARGHENPQHAHPIGVLRTMAVGHGGVDRSLEELEKLGLAQRAVGWALTPEGWQEVKRRLPGFPGEPE